MSGRSPSVRGYEPSPAVAAFVAQRRLLLIDGAWVDSADGATLTVEDPTTGAQVATVAEGGAAEIDRAVAAARRAFDDGAWRWLPTAQRARLLQRLAELVEQHGDELAQLDALDAGVPVTSARYAVEYGADQLRYLAGLATKIEGATLPPSSLPGDRFSSQVLREPLGVVGAIVPWNSPFSAAVDKLAPTLATANTLVLKPAEQTPLSALRLGELALEAGVPAGVVNVVPGYGHVAGAALAAHPGIDKIAFTGSTEIGKRIVVAAAANLPKVSLELGGKSPNVVFADADLSEAIPGAANAIFDLGGQSCVAGSRLFVHEDVYDEVVAGVAAEAAKIAVGDALDPATAMGPLVSQRQRERVLGYVDAGLRDGSATACGGSALDRPGWFMEPTILTRTAPTMSVEREEIFGPVVTAIPFRTREEVTARANDTIYGLAAGVWTSDVKTAQRMTRDLRAGVVWVNCYNVFDVALPFGGYKQSGWGRESGRAAIDLYTQTKTVTNAY